MERRHNSFLSHLLKQMYTMPIDKYSEDALRRVVSRSRKDQLIRLLTDLRAHRVALVNRREEMDSTIKAFDAQIAGLEGKLKEGVA